MMKPTKEELLKRAMKSIEENEPDGTRTQLTEELIKSQKAYIKKTKWVTQQPHNDELHKQVIQQYISLLETELQNDIFSKENISERGFCLIHSLAEFQMDKAVMPDTRQQVHRMVSDLCQRVGSRLKRVHTFSYHGFPSPAAGLSQYVKSGEIFSGTALTEKKLQAANETIGALKAKVIDIADETNKKIKEKTEKRRETLKEFIEKFLLKRKWELSNETKFRLYLHKGLRGELEKKDQETFLPSLTDSERKQIEKLKVDRKTFKDDLSALEMDFIKN